MQLALAGGAFLARPPASPNDRTDADLERRERRFWASCDGFDVHCAVHLAADDDVGRERLVRYCTRPPFALERIEVLRDGRIAYLLKVPRKASSATSTAGTRGDKHPPGGRARPARRMWIPAQRRACGG